MDNIVSKAEKDYLIQTMCKYCTNPFIDSVCGFIWCLQSIVLSTGHHRYWHRFGYKTMEHKGTVQCIQFVGWYSTDYFQVTQYSCDFPNLAPDGCTQWYFGSTTAQVQSYNFDGGQHLANQDQNICIRRERGNCRICWATAADTDFAVSGLTAGGAYVQAAVINLIIIPNAHSI